VKLENKKNHYTTSFIRSFDGVSGVLKSHSPK